MSTDPYLKDNILYQPITKGLDYILSVGSPDLDLTQYTAIRADFKATRSLDSPALFRFELGSGITVTADTLVLTVPKAKTAKIKFPFLYMDIKAIAEDGSLSLLLESEHKIKETNTDL